MMMPNSERGAQLRDHRVVRRGQRRVGQDAFQHLGVDFDPGHGRIDGRGLLIEQAGRRGADQDQPLRDPIRA